MQPACAVACDEQNERDQGRPVAVKEIERFSEHGHFFAALKEGMRISRVSPNQSGDVFQTKEEEKISSRSDSWPDPARFVS